jgi:hypothetical protein
MTIVSWTDLSRQRFPQAIGHNVREYCDANGNFQIKRLGRSRYLLTARDESGNLAQRLLDTTSGGSAPFLELQLQPATAVVLVNSEPTGSFTVVAVDERQQTRNAVAVAPGSGSRATLRLSPGAYTLRVYDSRDQLVRSAPIAVGSHPFRVPVP